MGLLASVLAFICFFAASIVMVSAMGEEIGIDLLGTNLPATMFGALGFFVLAGTVLASRKQGRITFSQLIPTIGKTSNCPIGNPSETDRRA